MEDLFKQFHKKIQLTSAQKKDARKKYIGVCKKLHGRFYPTARYTGDTKLLIGSYGKGTNIRPPRDVDVIFKMPASSFAGYADNTSNAPSQLLQDVRNILSEKYSTTEKISAWGKVVLVNFSEGSHNVEVLPAWENEDGTFTIPNTKNGGSWDNWNPRSELENIKTFSENNGVTKTLIRIIKKWSENTSVDLESYKIELAVLAYLFSISEDSKSIGETIKDFFNFYYTMKLDSFVVKSHIKTACERSEKAWNYEDKSEYYNASLEWKKVFGDDFPTYVESNVMAADKKKLRGHDDEEFLDKNYGIYTHINPNYHFRIDAKVVQSGYRVDWLSNRPMLKKHKKMTFQIIESENNIPDPYKVMWKVKNFGREAAKAGDLRGEITSDGGKHMKEEDTKYRGRHYVECYIIQNNKCVAISKLDVPISSYF